MNSADIAEAATRRAAADVEAAVVQLRAAVAEAPEYERGWTNDGRYPRVFAKRAMLAGMLAHIEANRS